MDRGNMQTGRTSDLTTGSIAVQLMTELQLLEQLELIKHLIVLVILLERPMLLVGTLCVSEQQWIQRSGGHTVQVIYQNQRCVTDINITMWLQLPTPETKATDGQANLLGHVEITHTDLSVSQRVKMDNPDSNGQLLMSIRNANKLGMTSCSSDVYGSPTST